MLATSKMSTDLILIEQLKNSNSISLLDISNQ